MKINNNPLLQGWSGKIGNIIFYQRNGKTVARKVSTARRKKPSPKQEEQKYKFKKAAAYAHQVTRELQWKQAYETAASPGLSAYNMAMADYFHPPTIRSVNTSKYTGKKGSTITAVALDDFKVVRVVVRVTNELGRLVEQGDAVKQRGNTWKYTSLVSNRRVKGFGITVIAYDLPGNLTIEEKGV